MVMWFIFNDVDKDNILGKRGIVSKNKFEFLDNFMSR